MGRSLWNGMDVVQILVDLVIETDASMVRWGQYAMEQGQGACGPSKNSSDISM